jgi:hypothetical protein
VRKPTERPALIADDDAVRWFARLERALGEGDYPFAAIARDRLDDLGWMVEPVQKRPKPIQDATGQGGGHVS